MEKNECLEIIKTRRSCRKYRPEQITDEELKLVLEAGAPLLLLPEACRHLISWLYRTTDRRRNWLP